MTKWQENKQFYPNSYRYRTRATLLKIEVSRTFDSKRRKRSFR